MLIRGIQEPGPEGAPARDAVRRFSKALAAEISKGQGLGFVRDDIDPARVAERALVIVLGFLTLRPVLGLESAESDPAPAIEDALSGLFGSLTW
jgi:hypothetical protein